MMNPDDAPLNRPSVIKATLLARPAPTRAPVGPSLSSWLA